MSAAGIYALSETIRDLLAELRWCDAERTLLALALANGRYTMVPVHQYEAATGLASDIARDHYPRAACVLCGKEHVRAHLNALGVCPFCAMPRW